ncbi:MAG: class I SAM-dependent methyltransferase [bacterium]
MPLTVPEARAYYDRFGSKQDSQGFYEDPALDALVRVADFAHAEMVLEFGCGTGKFAERLLSRELPESARYVGCDVSPVMIDLATRRTAAFGDRCSILRSESDLVLPAGDRSCDRLVTTYVLDLLSEADISRFLQEAHRILAPGGRLGVVGLTHGVTWLSTCVSRLWRLAYDVKPAAVGGCRPQSLTALLDSRTWNVAHREVVIAWGVPSEVVVAEPRERSPRTPT